MRGRSDWFFCCFFFKKLKRAFLIAKHIFSCAYCPRTHPAQMEIPPNAFPPEYEADQTKAKGRQVPLVVTPNPTTEWYNLDINQIIAPTC